MEGVVEIVEIVEMASPNYVGPTLKKYWEATKERK